MRSRSDGYAAKNRSASRLFVKRPNPFAHGAFPQLSRLAELSIAGVTIRRAFTIASTRNIVSPHSALDAWLGF
jgi:hypothetical protein